MEAGYEIQHWFMDDCLGENHRVAIQHNYPSINIVSTSYYNRLMLISDYAVAIFKLKPKTNANTITTT